MFSLSVVDTDWFLDLPLSTQALYFHLNMRADDDGFVDAPNSIVRKIGASKNDFDLLLAKRYILQFDSGIIVIKHWRMHNTIRQDRVKHTQFQEEFKQLRIKDNGSYTDNFETMTPTCQPSDNQVTTKPQQNGSVDIGLDLDIGLDIDINNISCSKRASIQTLFDTFWSAYPRKTGKEKCLKWFNAHKPDEALVKKMVDTITKFKNSKQWSDPQYIPYPYTWLNRGGWDDELDKKQNSSSGIDVEWEELPPLTDEDYEKLCLTKK